MKNYAILTAVNVITALVILFARTNAGSASTICFDPSTAHHYSAQGHAGYTFRTTNGNTLVIETRGKPGAAICTRTPAETQAEKRFNQIWPNAGC